MVHKYWFQYIYLNRTDEHLQFMGLPNCIEGEKYRNRKNRNALMFNLVLVFTSNTNTEVYKPIVRKLAYYLTGLEVWINWNINPI